MWFVEMFIAFSMLMLSSYGDWIMLSKAARAPISKYIYVNPDGHAGNYTTIQGAIDEGVPVNNTRWIVIKVAPGIYRESIRVPPEKPYIVIEGGSSSNTIVAWDATYDLLNATFEVEANNFMAKGITFKNTWNHQPEENIRRPAVAALISGDQNAFYECGFIGVQDTLFDRMGRHFFQSCYIEGFVDFIFGDGTSVYQNCVINATSAGYITAQKRSIPNGSSGFVFKYGYVFGTGPTYLGRAYGPYSRVLFYKTILTDIVAPEGWDAWGYKGHEDDITYAEIACTGRGADTSKRVPWEKKLSDTELQYLIGSSFLDSQGWVDVQPDIP